MVEAPAPAAVPTRSYGRKRKMPAEDSTPDEIPSQKIPTDPSTQERFDTNTSPAHETIPSPTPIETTAYEEQKKVRGGRAKRQNQQFNGHDLKTIPSNNNDILPSPFDAASATPEHTEKIDGDGAIDDFEKPSVKLVISKKKGSIFKSRAIEAEAGECIKQKRHVYKHKWDDDLAEEERGSAHDA